MRPLHIITPVKDSIPSAIQTAGAVLSSKISRRCTYTIYNDYSTPENTALLERYSKQLDFGLVNLSDLTSHPSPNYLLTLQHSQRLALDEGADLMIVESDVVVAPDTIQRLSDSAAERSDCGIAAAVTVDEMGVINYPYDYARGREGEDFAVRRHCSFCCSLLTNELLSEFDFRELDADKHWFDVTISQKALALGFNNYLFCSLPVVHRPHTSRPWKQLKYAHPLRYYWTKFTKGFDKI